MSKNVVRLHAHKNPQADFLIYNKKNKLVWRHLKHDMNILLGEVITLKPQQSISWNIHWNKTDSKGQKIPFGEYYVTSEVLIDNNNDNSMITLPIRFKLKPKKKPTPQQTPQQTPQRTPQRTPEPTEPTPSVND